MSTKGFDAQWSREGLVEILDTIDEGIHAVDLTGKTAVYNRAAGRLDGLRPEDVVGKHVLEAFPSLEHSTSTLLQVLKTGQPIYNQPQTYTNYHGVKVHTVNTTLPILSDSRLVGALEIAKDLTQVKRLSEQVLELQAQVAEGSGRHRRKGGSEEGTTHPSGAVYLFSHILTNTQALNEIKERAARVAQTNSPVLVYGETGTGKELLVQAIHNASPRRTSPFLALNCAALPASLLEGLLFGTVRGSFTGAENRAGLFELADGGTLFLDEIQSMPLELQAKLLRVLQEGELMRVGDVRMRRVDVRVMAAMNELPESAMQQGKLRPDLFYRINVVRFDLPALRDRIEDLPLLTAHLIGKWSSRFGTHVTGVDSAVSELFRVYPWPGNVREMENAIEASMNVVSEGDIPFDALPGHLRDYARKVGLGVGHGGDGVGGVGRPGSGLGIGSVGSAENSAHVNGIGEQPETGRAQSSAPDWSNQLMAIGMGEFWTTLSQGTTPTEPSWRALQLGIERVVIQQALDCASGNILRAAKLLQMPRQTLQYRLKQLGL